MIGNFVAWLDDRTGVRSLLGEALYERIPGGARWRYVWGSTLVFTFAVEVITGVVLWAAYSPSAQTAWESVYYIEHEMFLGSVVHGIHHFSAQAMVVLLGIHLMQVIIDGAYKAPREVNFWLGMILMQIVLGLSLTGYLLPWDQKGYYATQVSTKIMGAVPIVGPSMQEVVQGGPKYGHHTLTRFLAMHAGILPGLLIFFLVLHIYIFRRHGITVRDRNRAPDTTFWPDQVLRDAVACLGVLAIVLTLAIFKGAELSGPANPSEAYAAARPEWYFLSLFRLLKFESVEHFGLAFGAIYVPGAAMAVVILMPIIAMKWKSGHKFNVTFMSCLSAVVVTLTALAMYEDANNQDHQAAISEARRDAERVVELAQRESKIPVEGAVSLLREDPFTQGPRLFAKHCASCHRYNGHNGRGRVVTGTDPDTEKRPLTLPTAADLGNFASRDWMMSVITDYENHFAAVRFSNHYKEMSTNEAAGEDHLDPSSSEMADWSGDKATLLSNENKDDLNALIEFLVAEAGHAGVEIDEAKATTGRAIALDGTWVSALQGISCVDCHDTIGQTFVPQAEDEGGGYPDLAEYGSATWLKSFIRDPGSAQFYGAKNQMLAFDGKMTEKEVDLLVRWLTKDYYQTEVADYKSEKARVDAAIDNGLRFVSP